MSLDGSNYSDLSNAVSSNNFYFYNNIYNDITPSSTGSLTLLEAESVHLTKLKLTFQKGPIHFHCLLIFTQSILGGKKMSYHL